MTHIKDHIIRLLQQDLKHSQMLGALESIGLIPEAWYYLGLQDIILDLMHVPKGPIREHWANLYVDFMDKAIRYERANRSDELKPLATECYYALRVLLENHSFTKVSECEGNKQ